MARASLFAAFAISASALMLDTSKKTKGADRCLVWHSQHKSGGQAITNHLWRVPMTNTGLSLEEWRHSATNLAFICDKQTWNCEEQKCVEPDEFKESTAAKGVRIAMRGYVQTLRGTPQWGEAGDGKCIWATMSREPTSRLVSAYLYCKHEFGFDPLCGFNRLDAKKATLQEFAEHWGNYLFRELLYFPDLRTLAESRPDFNSTKFCVSDGNGRSIGDKAHSWQDPWVQFKDQLNGGDSLSTESGRKNFEAVKNHLLGRNGYKPLYDVVGLLEEWSDTMILFDNFIPLDDPRNWSKAMGGATAGTHNSWKYDDEKHQVLDQARKDPVVQKAIAADLELYNKVIVPIFHEEVKKYKNSQ